MFQIIFTQAFSLNAGIGGVAGITMRQAIRYGVARGVYSNEAGEGSAAVFHSSAEVAHPVQQGVFGILEVFIDTMLICSATGFVIIISGVYTIEAEPIVLVTSAFAAVIPQLKAIVYISLLLFSFTSMMGQWYFGHVSLNYLKLPGLTRRYRYLFPLLVIVGSLSSVKLVWHIQDCVLALLIIPNIIALVLLANKVRSLTKEFFDNI